MANEQYELYQQGTAAALAERMLDLLDGKAETDGYYTMLTAGAADNLTARGDGVTASFLYRTTGGSASVPDDAEATVRSIKGRTLGWNQLVYNPDFSEASGGGAAGFTASGVSSQTYANGVATIVTSVNYAGFGTSAARQFPVAAGRKYLFAIDVKSSAGDSLSMFVNSDGESAHRFCTGYVSMTADTWVSVRRIGECPVTASTGSFTVQDPGGANAHTIQFRNPQLFDLTQMFGAGNEPATVAEFESLYPLPYYPYDAGSLLPVNMTGVETVGFNQWDGTFKSGNQHFNYTTGEFDSTGGWVCTDKIPAFPDTVYYARADTASGSTSTIIVGCWDAGDNYLGSIRYSAWNGTTNATKPNTAYIRAEWTQTASVTNVCINLSWSGYRNGEYEPYWHFQRVIDAGVLRGAGSVYDEQTKTERITRVGVVDLTDITWTDSVNYYSTAYVLPNAKTPASGGVVANMSCADYEVTSSNNVSTGAVANGIGLRPNGTLYVSKGSASPSGMLFYELATPTTTPFPQPINMDYRFADFGTERVMVPTGQMSAPPIMDVVYGLNATDTLRTLPTEYVSKASDASFTAALGTFLNATITREWDETNQRYDYTITANGE